jgi:hypothetical protein
MLFSRCIKAGMTACRVPRLRSWATATANQKRVLGNSMCPGSAAHDIANEFSDIHPIHLLPSLPHYLAHLVYPIHAIVGYLSSDILAMTMSLPRTTGALARSTSTLLRFAAPSFTPRRCPQCKQRLPTVLRRYTQSRHHVILEFPILR